MMTPKTLDSISIQMRNSFEKMLQTSEKMDIDSAIIMFREIVKQDPEFIAARARLRELEIQNIPNMKGMKVLLSSIAFTFIMLLKKIFLKKEYNSMLATCEDALSVNIRNIAALQAMAEIAAKNEAYFISIEAMELAHQFKPKDKKILQSLAEFYLKGNRAEEAAKIYQSLLAKSPNNAKLKAALKEAAIAISYQKDSSTSSDDIAKTPKQVLQDAKNKEAEDAIIQQILDGTIRDEDQAKLVVEKLSKVVKETNSLDAHRKLAEAYKVARKYDQAIAHLDIVAKSLGALDAKLDKDIERLYVLKYDEAIENVEKNPQNYDNADETLETLKEEKQRYKIQRAKARSDQFINDVHLHYELAVEYYEAGFLDEAFKEFEISQKNAQHKGNSLYYMARILLVDGDVDRAMPLLIDAHKNMGIKDRNFKPAAYYLGVLYENDGNEAKAQELFKEVYKIMPNYKDVAQRIKK